MTTPNPDARLRKLLAKASKGPWSPEPIAEALGRLLNRQFNDGLTETAFIVFEGQHKIDAELIAAAVNALPALLDRIEALEAGLSVPVLDPPRAEEHPLLKAILDKRKVAAATFTPEFAGQRGMDFDRGLLCAFEAVNAELQRMTAARDLLKGTGDA